MGPEVLALVPLAVVALIALAAWWLARRWSRRKARDGADPDGVKPFGIGGWLAIFLFFQVVVSPIVSTGHLSSAFANAETQWPALAAFPPWGTYKALSWAVSLAVIGWQLLVAFRLTFRFVPESVHHAKVMLLVSPVIAHAADALFAKVLLDRDIADASLVALARAMFGPLIWWLYFNRSKRVRNTYYAAGSVGQPPRKALPLPMPNAQQRPPGEKEIGY